MNRVPSSNRQLIWLLLAGVAALNTLAMPATAAQQAIDETYTAQILEFTACYDAILVRRGDLLELRGGKHRVARELNFLDEDTDAGGRCFFLLGWLSFLRSFDRCFGWCLGFG